MAKKYYGVKAPEQKIFDNWNDCKAFTNGLKGAVFKGFDNYHDCYNFVYDDRAELNPQEAFVAAAFNVNEKQLVSSEIHLNKALEAHVDGSYNKQTGEYGSGVVFVQDGIRVFELFFSGVDGNSEWQIAGEAYAALAAVEKAVEMGFEEISIWHDLIHLSAWPLGYYSTSNSALGRKYVQSLADLEKFIKVKFVKEAAHAGHLFNERADRLAKMGCDMM